MPLTMPQPQQQQQQQLSRTERPADRAGGVGSGASSTD